MDLGDEMGKRTVEAVGERGVCLRRHGGVGKAKEGGRWHSGQTRLGRPALRFVATLLVARGWQ